MNGERIERYFEGMLTDAKIPVLGYAFCLYDRKDILLEKQGGIRRITPEGTLPVTADTRYRIASVSKMFTTLAVMQLKEKGLLDLDEDAGKYLGWPLRNPDFPDTPITLRMLLSHTSSIRDTGGYILPHTLSLSEYFLPGGRYWKNGCHFAKKDEAADVAPGKTFTYANIGFALLGAVVESVSRERFDDYEREHVLRPMGLKADFLPGMLEPEAFAELASLYKRMNGGKRDINGPWTALNDGFDGVQPPKRTIWIMDPDSNDPLQVLATLKDDLTEYTPGVNPSGISPQGGLRISARELSVFARMILNKGLAPNGKRILSEESVKEIETPVHVYDPLHPSGAPGDSGRSYGAGFNIISTKIGYDRVLPERDLTLYGHTGSASGLFSACYWSEEHGRGFAYAFTGTGDDPDKYPSAYSPRCCLQADTMAVICRDLME